MSVKLEKIAAERERACRKRDEWDEKVKEWDKRYKEQENAEICDVVHAMNLNPEQLAEIIRIAQQGGSPSPDKINFFSGNKEEETE